MLAIPIQELLTIAIPTYNRHRLLKEQIQNLIPQLNNEVKVVILDNSSNPPVDSYLGELCDDKIKVHTNVVNIGADANICRCFEYCDTEWLWVLSDDDIIKGNAVTTVLNLIKNHKDSVFINFKASRDYTTKGLAEFCKQKPDYSNAFCISICVYNSLKLKPLLIQYYDYLSSMHGQLVLVLKYLESNNEGVSCFSSDLIISTFYPTEWSKVKFIERLPIFLSAFKGKSLELIKEAYADSIVYHLLLFGSNLRIQQCLTRKEQFILFFNLILKFNINNFISKSNLKQFTVFIVCLFSSKVAAKVLTLHEMYKNRQ